METKKMSRKKQIPHCNYGPYPWLVYPTQQKQFFCPLPISISDSKPRPRIRSIPALRGLYTKILYSSSYGGSNWHLILKNSYHLSIWNQNNSNSITLPPLPEDYANFRFSTSIMFFSSGSSSKCSVMLFHSRIRVILFYEISITNADETQHDTWSVIDYGETMREMFDDIGGNIRYPVSRNGELYVIYYSEDNSHKYTGHLGIIKVVDGKLFFQPTNNSLPRSDSNAIRPSTYFLHSFGDLVLTYITFGGVNYKEIIDFEIYKLDFQANDWKKIVNSDSFNDRIFFLGYSYSFSCLTNDHNGGRVFFTKYGDDKSLYSYIIEDESLTITLPCPKLPKPWESPYWISTYQTEQVDDDDGSEDDDDEEDEDEEDEDEDGMEEEDDDGDSYSEEEEDSEEEDDDSEEEEGSFSRYDHSVKLLMSSTVNNQIFIVEEEGIDYFSQLISIDVFEEIKRKLDFTEYRNFRRVSKGCRMTAPLSDLPKLQTVLSLPPWSIRNLTRSTIYNFVDPSHNIKYLMKIPQHLVDANIRYSQNGWLLMTNRSSNCMFFYNPFTKNTINLPYPPPGYTTFGFWSSSSSFSYWVCVGLFGWIAGSSVDICYIKSGEEEWHSLQTEESSKFLPHFNTPVVLCGEDGQVSFYFLGVHGDLGVFKLDLENVVEWKVLENPKKPCKYYESNFLLECGRDLVSVFVGKVGTWVRVFKLNQNQTEWEEVTDLRNYTLYISRYSSFSQPATVPSMANTIYFSKFFEGRLIYYSLDTRRFHCFKSGMSMAAASQGSTTTFDSFYDQRIRGPLYSDWILPRFS